ncbi:MAG TPA: hypothetical protein VKA14_04580 [Gammaproteobacteria bacterium]|nr:hypothetical protein [Gammaproteobacteria bacterium]
MEATGNQQVRHAPRVNMFGGWTTEALGGAAAVVLTILGLSGVAHPYTLTVAGIALGLTLLVQGSVVMAEYSAILTRTGAQSDMAAGTFGGGLSTQAMAGASAVILSILALLGLHTIVLMGVVSIVLGGGLVLSSGVDARLEALKIELSDQQSTTKRVAEDAMSASTGADVMVGVAAVVLGILALIGIAPMNLNLVALLAIGTAVLLRGSTIAGRIMSLGGAMR